MSRTAKLLGVSTPTVMAWIERDHSRQRHWLARLRRRTCVVSKAVRMVDASIALFARFGGNDKIDDLVAMLA
jgi:insertion element IS1 protein InsB